MGILLIRCTENFELSTFELPTVFTIVTRPMKHVDTFETYLFIDVLLCIPGRAACAHAAKNLRLPSRYFPVEAHERGAFIARVHDEEPSAQRRGVSAPRARVRYGHGAYETRTGIPRNDAAMFLAHRLLVAVVHLKLQWKPTIIARRPARLFNVYRLRKRNVSDLFSSPCRLVFYRN